LVVKRQGDVHLYIACVWERVVWTSNGLGYVVKALFSMLRGCLSTLAGRVWRCGMSW
jgi:hypothetical protein